MLFAFTCSTRFGEFTIPPDELELLDEELDEELEEELPDELELPPLEELEDELLPLEELLEEEPEEDATQEGILVELDVLLNLWQKGVLLTQRKVSVLSQSGIKPGEQ